MWTCLDLPSERLGDLQSAQQLGAEVNKMGAGSLADAVSLQRGSSAQANPMYLPLPSPSLDHPFSPTGARGEGFSCEGGIVQF